MTAAAASSGDPLVAPPSAADPGVSALAHDARGDVMRRGGVARRGGVIDIGSNSVRLVVYDLDARTPTPIYNEKVVCALGRDVAETGQLNEEGVRSARATLRRFSALGQAMGLEWLRAVATAAVRDAKNGAAFARGAKKASGLDIAVLSGEEEARFAAEGVMCGFPDADGLVADLGGGSLEVSDIAAGVIGRGETLPIGPLMLSRDGAAPAAAARVDEALAGLGAALDHYAGRALYLVGGAWRALAALHMAEIDHPLRVLQGYEADADSFARFAETLIDKGPKDIAAMGDVSKRRAAGLPYGALVVERLIARTRAARVVISAYGLREGLLFESASALERSRDPLIAAAKDLEERRARCPGLGKELYAFTAPLFPDEPERLRRLREAACRMSDIGWRWHPDFRAINVLRDVATAPMAAVSHEDRAALGLTLHHRYQSRITHEEAEGLAALLPEDRRARVRALGAALRLGHMITGATPGLLTGWRFELDAQELRLLYPPAGEVLVADLVSKRLGTLADAMERKASLVPAESD